jgi:hypothetical protein
MMTTPSIPTFQQVVKRNHHVYKHKEIDEILNYLSQTNLPWGALTKISNDSKIPQTTLGEWRRRRCSEGGEKWFPNASGHPQQRIFTHEIEDDIYEFMMDLPRKMENATRCS